MSSLPESTSRSCDWPFCDQVYNALAVLMGRSEAPGWVRFPSLHLDLCAQHSWVWGEKHDQHIARNWKAPECSCGERLRPSGPSLERIKIAYLAHLVLVAETLEGQA